MSMIGIFRACSTADREALLSQPSRIKTLLYDEPFDMPDPSFAVPGFLSKFLGQAQPAPTATADDWEPECKGEEMDVDKAWNGIHFLLTGTSFDGE